VQLAAVGAGEAVAAVEGTLLVGAWAKVRCCHPMGARRRGRSPCVVVVAVVVKTSVIDGKAAVGWWIFKNRDVLRADLFQRGNHARDTQRSGEVN